MFDLYKYLKAIDVKTVDDSINKLIGVVDLLKYSM